MHAFASQDAGWALQVFWWQGAERFPFCLTCRVFGTDSRVDTTKRRSPVSS